jgi:hypothetical protein
LESELFLELLTLYRQTGELPPSRRGVIHHLTMVEEDTRQQVVRKLRQAGAVTIALDGWTNIRQEKVTNIVPIASGVSYYWESIVNRMEANTADWQRPLIKKAIESVIGCGVPVVAMVTDNEAVNGSLYRLLLPDFPFLVHVPCAAHTIQLCVNKMLELPEVRSIMSEMRRLLRFFKKHKSARNQLKQIQSTLRAGMAVLALIKPNDTRWSSTMRAGERLIKLKQCIGAVISTEEHRHVLSSSFWDHLEAIAAFLKPFQVATDIVQADESTLMDIYHQFITVMQHVEALHAPNILASASFKNSCVSILRGQWEQHVNKMAVIACAILSFDTSYVNIFSGEERGQAVTWFLDFSVKYVRYYKLSSDLDENRLKGNILLQWSDFKSGEGVFCSIHQQKELLMQQQSSAAKGKVHYRWNARKVWNIYRDDAKELSFAALALLSISASEAGVERTFSMQDVVHSKIRNRLQDIGVQREMFVKYNYRALTKPSSSEGCWVELEDEWESGYTTSSFNGPLRNSDVTPDAGMDDDEQLVMMAGLVDDDSGADSELDCEAQQAGFENKYDSEVDENALPSAVDSEVHQEDFKEAEPARRQEKVESDSNQAPRRRSIRGRAAAGDLDTAPDPEYKRFIAQYIKSRTITPGFHWSGEEQNLLQMELLMKEIPVVCMDMKGRIMAALQCEMS